MNKYILMTLLLLGVTLCCKAQFGHVKLIAHRGGVVDEQTDENSIASIEKAAAKGYYMVELDVRMTKDSVLIVHHDRDLKRFFGVDKKVDALNWDVLRSLKSANGHTIQKLEDMLRVAADRRLQVMIDLKIQGYQSRRFEEIYTLLSDLHLADRALIIPTEEATDFFRGKIKLSCTKMQIEDYQQRSDYAAQHYYLFSNPSPDDFQWAKRNNIQVVGVINYHPSKKDNYEESAKALKEIGVEYIQLDSRFDKFF
ncbi:glycerophosphodiester phosphodiesterase [Sphingobacterium sp. SGR-19]|uniref:glycerophosphodiester phosphodiesterase n=1 Tax=Sphingobacterium sp. SGR-19 TaxID=2710886 RepID=UPI0013EA3BF6|nr:glycerophosphodiester phosphodiesterase family protein [Sphingobacterium sp. SGR-19]NGM67068.1 hypothetical protein [Sphingobacterium sp. SGR-19]